MNGSGYRDSHAEKGAEYHESFTDLPHRKMLWELEKSALTRIVSQLSKDRDLRYLDFACGTGRILGHVSNFTGTATGVDISESMIEVARRQLPASELIHADLTRDDQLGARKFDLITAFRFFPNAEPDLREEAIAVLVRHLAPQGRLIFNNHKNSGSLLRRIANALGRVDPNVEAGRTRLMSRSEVRELAGGADLEIEREIAIATLPFTDRHMMKPVAVLQGLESALSRLPVAALAQDLIYVCRHAA